MSSRLVGVSFAILAGGLGTRLRSAVPDRPKVLAPVAGRPFLAHLFDQLAKAGAHHVALLVGHAADQVQEAFGDSYRELALTYSREPEPLGTGGALRLALPLLTETTIVLFNGDSYCDVDFSQLVADHRGDKRRATLTLAQVEDSSRYGRVNLDDSNRITRFEEKGGSRESGWINAGIYVLSRNVVADIPEGRPVSLEREVLPDLILSGKVIGFPGRSFIDIGTPESYAEAEAFFRSTSRD
jgi:NDP-sugar pyrophosphorylase family protein